MALPPGLRALRSTLSILACSTLPFPSSLLAADAPFPITPDDPSYITDYYNVDWNAPPHATGSETATGGTTAPSRVILGSPTVESSLGVLSETPLVFDTASSLLITEEIEFVLNQGERVYSISLDTLVTGHGLMPIEDPEPGEEPDGGEYGDFSIHFGELSAFRLSFDQTGDLLFYHGGSVEAITSYSTGQVVNLRIQIDLDTGTFYFSIGGAPFVPVESPSFTDTDLTTLRIRLDDATRMDGVSAIDNVMISGFTNPVNPPTFSIDPPSAVSLDESVFGQIEINWNPVPEADYYEISWRKLGDTEFSFLEEVNSTTFLHQNLSYGRIYGYQIEAFAEVDGVLYRSGPSSNAIGFAGNVTADLALGASSTRYKGQGINNGTANGQRHAFLTPRRGNGAFYFGAFNSGSATGKLIVQASRVGRFVRATFQETDSGANVTAGLLRGDLQTDALTPDEAQHYRCLISIRYPKRKRKKRKKVYRQEITLASHSYYSLIRQDVAQAAAFSVIPKKKKKKKRRKRRR
ncbi:MAG: hypothetical protein CMO55_27640 [Verrucomicrobiales bacterium]|nr:hypothetical protein [Verrucomicrobiales bacterium]